MKKIYLFLLLICLTILAEEQTVQQDTNTTANTQSNISDKNSIPQKTINFFGGIVDDAKDFLFINKIIDKK